MKDQVQGQSQQVDIETDTDLRSAICIYLIGERPDGATVAHLAGLCLAGRTPVDEVAHVSNAVSELGGRARSR